MRNAKAETVKSESNSSALEMSSTSIEVPGAIETNGTQLTFLRDGESKMSERCFACGKKLGKGPAVADTRDAQMVIVGSECAKLIKKAGNVGYQPPQGGPRLYPVRD